MNERQLYAKLQEIDCGVTKLKAENEMLHKENEFLKQQNLTLINALNDKRIVR